LFRQSEIYARQGVEISRSTLAGWLGAASDLLSPLVEAIGKHVFAGGKLHADDTPMPVLAPGTGKKTKTGRLWTYVRDDRSAGEQTAPAVSFAYSEDRRGEHPRQHLKNFIGALQADAYAGYVANAVMLREHRKPRLVGICSLIEATKVNSGYWLSLQAVVRKALSCSMIFSRARERWLVSSLSACSICRGACTLHQALCRARIVDDLVMG
jgi:hypothetical protein